MYKCPLKNQRIRILVSKAVGDNGGTGLQGRYVKKRLQTIIICWRHVRRSADCVGAQKRGFWTVSHVHAILLGRERHYVQDSESGLSCHFHTLRSCGSFRHAILVDTFVEVTCAIRGSNHGAGRHMQS